MKRAVLTLLLLSLIFSGCGIAGSEPGGYRPSGGGGAPGPTGPDEPVVMTPPQDGSDVSDAPGRPQRVTPWPGMADVHPVAWEKARPLPDGRSLRVTYWSGVEPCNVLDHVDIRYGPGRITVTLREGHDPDEADTACIEIAVQKVVEVDLDEAVDGRKIVDGAA